MPDLGRLVRETRVAWALEQDGPKPSWLTGWDELDAGQREVDSRIGAAVEAEVRRRVAADFKRLAGDLQRHPLVSPGVPGIVREARRDAWLAAAQVALHGLSQDRADKEGTRP